MQLRELESYDSITIQTHDNPDADAIGSGYALYKYFKTKGKKVSLIYSGRYRIQKTNLKLMIEKMDIPITYHDKDAGKVDGLLITVDCQYGSGNVYPIDADYVAVIDHHQPEISTANLVGWEIATNLGSCSTLVWKMLMEENYPVNEDVNLGTALYYGLYCDTNQFSETTNPLDMDMREMVAFDNSIVVLLRNSNLSLKELEIAGIALIRYIYNNDFHYAIIQAQPCDPNILGLISDFVLQVDEIYTCVVFNTSDEGYKFSVRSCIKEVNASELARFLADDLGSGGGHLEKAGGFISMRKYGKAHPTLHPEAYFGNRLNEYFESFDVIDARHYEVASDAEQYSRKKVIMGYVKTDTLFPVGNRVTIRTIEGDTDILIQEEQYLLIEDTGRVLMLSGQQLEEAYKLSQVGCPMKLEYMPKVKNTFTGETLDLMSYAHSCTNKRKFMVYARELERGIKLFTELSKDTYMLGMPGDYLVAACDNPKMMHVVQKDVFKETYQKVVKPL
ncbi:MAG: recombinase RecJ [Lachnospiraceae bacterium]|nr:recombinase RecJ [Lachnospiraceae bacterium]